LSDDPFNLVTMTNTPGCTATLLALANSDKRASASGNNTMVQYLACDTLATLSHWLLTLSTTRKSKENGGQDVMSGSKCGGNDTGRRTFQQSTWEAWT
jgi:hypothetical protein